MQAYLSGITHKEQPHLKDLSHLGNPTTSAKIFYSKHNIV